MFGMAQLSGAGGWDSVALAAFTLINTLISAYTARRVKKVRDSQKSVAADLSLSGSQNGKEVK